MVQLMFQSAVEERTFRLEGNYADSARRCAELIDRLSKRLREVDPDPSHPLSAELFSDAADYCNILTGYVDDWNKFFNIHGHKDTRAFYAYVDGKVKERGWGVEEEEERGKKK
jgi:hypothetical protein